MTSRGKLILHDLRSGYRDMDADLANLAAIKTDCASLRGSRSEIAKVDRKLAELNDWIIEWQQYLYDIQIKASEYLLNKFSQSKDINEFVYKTMDDAVMQKEGVSRYYVVDYLSRVKNSGVEFDDYPAAIGTILNKRLQNGKALVKKYYRFSIVR